jgi:hypothetical protein
VRRVGFTVPVAEDFHDRRAIEGGRIANPFAPATATVIDTALPL